MINQRLMSICSLARRPIFRYSLQDKMNISDIRSWEIYADFLDICAKGDIRDLNVFHDQHLRPYESRLRRENEYLLFRDLTLYNPHDPDSCLVQIETPIYPRLMDTAEETFLERRGPERTLTWFKQIRRLQ